MNPMMKPMARMVFLALAAASLTPAMAADPKNEGYVLKTNDGVLMSGYGLCVRDSEWTPATSVEPCDPTMRPVAVAAPAPAPVAPAPIVVAAAPPPVVVQPEPVRAPPLKLSFSADALFDFDKSNLRPAGELMLDGLKRELSGATYEAIRVTGHTDRIGSLGYNQSLSERRANAVRDYLLSKDLPAARIDAEGRGKTQPITRAEDCRGPTSSKVIACLQPDRRVDVEVTGTQALKTGLN